MKFVIKHGENGYYIVEQMEDERAYPWYLCNDGEARLLSSMIMFDQRETIKAINGLFYFKSYDDAVLVLNSYKVVV